MSAPRRDSSQSPDPASGHGMGGPTKNGGEVMPNGPVLQPGEYDQWRSHSVYSHNGGFGPLTSTQPAQIPGDYMTNYYTPSPYTMNDHHGGWTTAGYYHPQGLSPPVSNQYMEHMTLFGGGPAPGSNSFFYNYFSTAPTNGSDYNAWGGPSIIPTPRSAAVSNQGAAAAAAATKHSEFYYPMMDSGGYTHYIGTDIVGGNTNGDNRMNVVGQAQQQQTVANSQFGYLEQGMNRMSVYDDAVPGAVVRTGQANGPYGGNGVAVGVGVNIVGNQTSGTITGQSHSSSSTVGESKKKSWATIASQPAKPNSGGSLGGPLAGVGKGKGRMPIGGIPGSGEDSGGGFWPSPVQSTPSKQEAQPPPPASIGTEKNSQRSYGGGLARNASEGAVGGAWSSTNSSSGKSAKNATVAPAPISDGIQSSAANGSGNSDSENGEYNNNETEKVEVVEVKPAAAAIPNSTPNTIITTSTTTAATTVEKTTTDSQKTSQRNFFDKSTLENDYNPKEFTLPTKGARYFVIKSYSEDDIHRSIKYGIWCSTEHGNKRLDGAYREREGKGPILLLFSVNGSGHFCGVAQMTSPLDYSKSSGVWAQDKWKGQFTVKWIYVKDVPNAQLRHIRLENNENKPVTNSRDTQEVPPEKGRQVVKIIHQYRHTTSLFDDFGHYEKRQEEEDQRKGRRAVTTVGGDE